MRRIAIGTVVAVLAVVGLWYAALWRPEGKALQAARSTEAQAAQQVVFQRAQLALLEAQRPQVAKEKALYQRLLQDVPYGPSLDQLMRTVHQAATKAGLQLESLSVSQPSGWGMSPASGGGTQAAGPGPQLLSVNISVKGPEKQMLRFVTALDSQPRIYVVSSFSLSNLSPATGTATATPQGAAEVAFAVDAFYQSTSNNNPTYPGTS